MEDSLHSCPNCMAILHSDSTPPLFKSNPAPRDIIDTNDPPADSQIPSLRDFISSAQARKIELNSAIDKLIQEREALDVEIQKHQGALSPLRRMPTEILSHIFTFTLRPHHPDAESAPWIVSAVCARWRAIVLCQPSFWNSIHIGPAPPKIPASGFRLQTQLPRSEELPLHVIFFCEDAENFTEREMELIDILAQYCARWETASIYGPEELYSAIEHHLRRQLPLLRKLRLEMFFEDESSSLNLFDDAPELQEVYVNTILWNFPIALKVPWPQLLKYGGSNTWGGHLDALRSGLNLVECTLEFWSNSTDVGTVIQLPHLLRLSLSEPAFLACLDTPALLELHCDQDSDLLALFFRRVPCKLQKLVLRDLNGDLEVSDLTAILDSVPTITYLGFPFLPVGFVHTLYSAPELAPALECMSFHLQPDIHDELVEALQSPVWQARKLRSLKMTLQSPSPDLLGQFDLIRCRGMEIAIFRSGDDRWADMIPKTLQLAGHY
ncbi:hypothetical protein FB451DRAFT_439970 [Mycena latifolia]|nr:hypothetical protein FB451DRAFT_439970 [Mycena latifolia]